MPIVAVRPDSTDSGGASPGWTLTGAASMHAALSDDSDSSWIRAEFGGPDPDNLRLGFPSPSIPAGAYVTGIMLTLRSKDFMVAGAFGCDGKAAFFSQVNTWSSPTTVYTAYIAASAGAELDSDNPYVIFVGVSSLESTIYEAWATAIYVSQPAVSAESPSGTLTTDNRPPIEWTNTLDSSGGAQTRYQVKLYDATTHGAFGSVDPDVTIPYHQSNQIAGSATSWKPTVGLPDDDYRAYVRTAQTVNGEIFWSDWDYIDFEIDVDLPGVPLISATAHNLGARIRVEVDEVEGDADTDGWEVEYSDDGETWLPARTLEAGGVITNGSPGASGSGGLFDYESDNGAVRYYRARAYKDHGSGVTVTSDWSETASASWTSESWWIKHPTDPSLNLSPRIFSQPGYTRPSRAGRFQGLGSATAIVVSDYPSSPQGEITFDLDSATEKAQLDALLATASPLLVQAPAGTHWDNRWAMLTDQERTPNVDKLEVQDSLDKLAWIEVGRPSGVISAWDGYADIVQSLGDLGLFLPLAGPAPLVDLSPYGWTATEQGGVTAGGLPAGSGPFAIDDIGATAFDALDDRITTDYGTRRNLCPDPRTVNTSTYWLLAASGTRSYLTDVSDHPLGITTAIRHAITGHGGSRIYADASPSTTYSVGAWMKGNAGITLYVSCQEWENSGADFVDETVNTATATGEWQWISASHTMGATADKVGIKAYGNTTATVDITGGLIEQAASAGTYFDGTGYESGDTAGSGNWIDDPGGHVGWLGTAHASASDKGCFANGTARTFSWWLNPHTQATQQCCFANEVSGYGLIIVGQLSGPHMWLNMGAAVAAWTNAMSGQVGLWGLCQMVVDQPNATAEFYLDGVSKGQLATPGTGEWASNANVMFGKYYSGQPLNGDAIGLAIHERGLSADEVALVAGALSP